MTKLISSDSESEDEPLIPEPKFKKSKRQYNRKPMSDKAKEAYKDRISKARAAKKETKVEKPKVENFQIFEKVEKTKEPTIINNHNCNEAPKKKEVKKKEPKEVKKRAPQKKKN